MQTQKMSLANIQGKLSRAEMKNIMAGSGDGTGCFSDADCPTKSRLCSSTTIYVTGRCYANPGTQYKTCHWGGCPY